MHKPDFSGEWILNREASSLSPGADAIRSGIVRIEHRDPKFQYKGEFVSDNGKVQPEFELMSEEQGDIAQQEMTSGASLRLRAVEQLRATGRSQDNIWIFDRN
jgi:hypothetical protein